MSLSPEVAGALRSLLQKTAAQNEDEAALIQRCWAELRENEEPMPTIDLKDIELGSEP